MKSIKSLLFVLAVAFAAHVSAQPLLSGTQSEYKASQEGWLVNIQEANVMAAKTGKPIMVNFTGSDWCGWCKKLKREVFVTDEFKTWADKNVILVEADFPRSFQIPQDIRSQNASLQQALGVRGYPTICIITLTNTDQGQININQLGRMGYVAGGPDAWIKEANAIVKK